MRHAIYGTVQIIFIESVQENFGMFWDIRLFNTLWIVGFATGPFNTQRFIFEDDRLQQAADCLQEGQEMAIRGEYQEARDTIMAGVFSGRKIVEKLQQMKEDQAPEVSSKALEWLISSYICCSKARIEMCDWDKARSDAWAACTFSQNTNVDALDCMLQVCEKTSDLFGQLTTLKSMEKVLHLPVGMEENGKDQRLSIVEVRQKISQVEKTLAPED